jgi:hypothetical protein
MKTRFLLFLALTLPCVVSACGSPRANATGKLTYKGQPVPSTLVQFWPVDGKRMSVGVTDDEGKFTLSYSRTEPGVLWGEHTVTLTYFPSEEEESGKIRPKVSKELKAVFANYSDRKKSTLKHEITTNGQYIEIDLK